MERAPLVQQPEPCPPMHTPLPSPPPLAGSSRGPLVMPQPAPPPYDARDSYDPTVARPMQDYGATRWAKSM